MSGTVIAAPARRANPNTSFSPVLERAANADHPGKQQPTLSNCLFVQLAHRNSPWSADGIVSAQLDWRLFSRWADVAI